MAIRLKQKQPKTNMTVPMFVNDAIGLRMHPEQLVFATPWSFGTADAISCEVDHTDEEKRELLRVHDLKTGEGAVKFDQLKVYGAMFCIEYDKDPFQMLFEFRIYQNDERLVEFGDPEEIAAIMAWILEASDILSDEARR